MSWAVIATAFASRQPRKTELPPGQGAGWFPSRGRTKPLSAKGSVRFAGSLLAKTGRSLSLWWLSRDTNPLCVRRPRGVFPSPLGIWSRGSRGAGVTEAHAACWALTDQAVPKLGVCVPATMTGSHAGLKAGRNLRPHRALEEMKQIRAR